MESKDSTKKLMFAVDQISTFVGKGAGWLIIVLMVMVCIDVFRRYVLNAPSAWIGELSVMSYGAVIMLSGAYTLAQNGHVRGDFLYGSMKPRTQATLDLILYIVFFLLTPVPTGSFFTSWGASIFWLNVGIILAFNKKK